MHFGRSFFFALLVASAIPALAADKASSPQLAVSAGSQTALTRGPYARQFVARAGLLPTEEETPADLGDPRVPVATPFYNSGCNTMRTYLDPGRPGDKAPGANPSYDGGCNDSAHMYIHLGRLPVPGTTVLRNEVCYTMRTYKVKPTERLAPGENASRGYSTCELASSFQLRSLVAPEETVGAAQAQSQQK